MTVAILDINDSNLQLWHENQALQSPGYALLEGKQYRFGQGARAAARLRPREINTRYWWQLNTEALQPALGSARHSADLAHAHLLDLHGQAGSPKELILAVSGSMAREQLALLLGIIKQCPFEAVGLVNRSVALGSLYGGPGKLFHLEIQLHQALVSELSESGGKVELQRSIPLPGCGLLQLQERLMEVIAATFIRQTRFDPRLKAGTEQQMYDALPTVLRQLLNDGETNIEVNGYRTRIVRSDLLEAGNRLFETAAQAVGVMRLEDRIILDPIAGLIPGLGDHFPGAELLPEDAMWQIAGLHEAQLLQRDQALHFITSLPCLVESITPSTNPLQAPTPAPVQATPAARQPTHVLRGSTAVPLQVAGTTLAGVTIFAQGQSWLLRGETNVQHNGTPYRDGQPLVSGDSITTAAAIELTLIDVES